MLANIKILLNISGNTKDALLNLLITQCSDEFKSITHKNVVVNSVVEQMVVFRYNKLGAEGLTSESYSGFTNDYSDNSYSPELMRQILAHRQIRLVE